jgi:hypothetical protein
VASFSTKSVKTVHSIKTAFSLQNQPIHQNCKNQSLPQPKHATAKTCAGKVIFPEISQAGMCGEVVIRCAKVRGGNFAPSIRFLGKIIGFL